MDNIAMLKMFSVMQDIATSDKKVDKKEWIKSKERLIFATNGIIKPDNWEELSDEVKEKRINKVLENLNKV
mgnify:CR=1 FL=1